MPISDTKARTAKPKDKPYKLLDAEGLYLEVRPTGKKYWRYRFNIGKKEGMFTVGEYPAVSLADARKERDWARSQARQGNNPNEVRKAEQAKASVDDKGLFRNVATDFAARKAPSWNAYYLKQFNRVMKEDVYPVIGDMRISDVAPSDCLKIIENIEGRGAPSIAVLARQWLSQIFRYGASKLLVDADPTFILKDAIVKKPVRHNPPLEKAEIPVFMEKLAEYGGYRPTVIAITILAHTFVRTGELRQAQWSEFDLDGALWVIPPERMKKRKKHLVPLSDQVIELLTELQKYTGNRPQLFPNLRRPDDVMTATTVNRALERMGYAKRLSGHGFRSTASTLLNEMGWRADVIERQLSHVEQKGERKAYNHAEYMDERREMMQAWSDYLDAQAAEA
ncbi:tyrosine-type recombinase/integrase [Marinobacterium jannaschii]|uniref:tyrosine-type recombinase/integrase n=1 Tax=Marinobacterium jannaschii TaxID=64970 RepID=UPI0004800010|nr:integrase arm-type DNA-binding domain-containing protein [Marinobacterium jannaschii]